MNPVLTPVVGDCVSPTASMTAASGVPQNLFYGGVNPEPETDGVWYWMGGVSIPSGYTIPRHGRRPRRVPTTWAVNKPLPGAINVAFFDGHAEMVPLEKLWQLSWHRDYVAPVKRPGLR